MRTMLVCSLLGLLLTACAAGNSAATPTFSPPQTTPLPDGAVLFYHRQGGFDGLDDAWTLFADGSVAHTGRDAPPTTTAGALTASEVAQLAADLEALGFMTLWDEYGQDQGCADCFYYTLTLSAGGQTKTVQWLDAARDAPEALWEAVGKVQVVVEALPPPP